MSIRLFFIFTITILFAAHLILQFDVVDASGPIVLRDGKKEDIILGYEGHGGSPIVINEKKNFKDMIRSLFMM